MKRIFSGGNHSFVSISNVDEKHDSRIYDSSTQIEYMTVDLIKSCVAIGASERIDSSLMSSVETTFRNIACMNGSFLQAYGEHDCCSIQNHGLSIEDAKTAFGMIEAMKNQILKDSVSILRFFLRSMLDG